ncbi:cyclic peptide export ABC transporter [Corallococcus praedator]|uniref:Cyclic peptide export ABC transporter n=1 Tax=Corallococcus praedator TaxID=2316724 RepID=A0ABX9QRV6_9BACT|nr:MULTISPECIES: cyclic peptide export ABC transporter [Corallococcus]RKH35464.1 cyclic peptide export ABC transporter [Corallococcus sp. CA031C]RKI17211.1 cyclic peptide export ABC transporter [Corallococcus praedator]
MNLLILLLRRSRGAVALAVFFGLLTGAASAGLIAHINAVLTSGGTLADRATVLGFAALGALMLGSRIGSQLLLTRLQTRTTFALRDQLSQRILATPLRQLEELGNHRLLATLIDDVQAVTQGLLCIPPLLIHGGIIVGCMTYLAIMSPMVFAALLVFAMLGVASYLLPMRHIMGLLRHSRQTNDRFFRDLRSLTQGLKELKLHGGRRTAFLKQELFPTAEALKQLQVKVSTLHTFTTSWSMSLFFFFIGLLLFALPGLTPVSTSTLVGYTLAVLYLQQPLESSMTMLPMLGAGTVALRHIDTLELAAAGSPLPLSSGEPPAPPSRIDLAGVTHAYRREGEDTPFTLGPIDLTLRPGEILFVVGGNGSGKTTLAKLITGLYTPESGEIRVDGRSVTEGDRERYRQLFATVFSDFHLFDSLLGLAEGDKADKARAYLTRLQLDRKVRINDTGALSTTDLSAGQRKRLALLTAYLEDRPVYLFDEWAADQDPLFKEVFYRELLPDLKAAGKAVVVISHDNRYFDVADRRVRLESGAIVAEESAAAPTLSARPRSAL